MFIVGFFGCICVFGQNDIKTIKTALAEIDDNPYGAANCVGFRHTLEYMLAMDRCAKPDSHHLQ